MKLTAKIKLNPTADQRGVLYQTMVQANAACNYISEIAWSNQTFSRNKLHELVYQLVREEFNLSAQVVVRCIGKVVDAYKLDKKQQRRFKKLGAIAYDSRILKYKFDKQEVSIWTMNGRETIPFLAGDHQHQLLKNQQGESDLMFIRGEFYLCATCDVEEPPTDDVSEYLGIDLGIVNIAADSDGEIISGSQVNNVRMRNRNLRKKLQSKGTKSAKRLLKKLRGREARFANDVNHCISKIIVEKAQRTQRGIALEELTGIRSRARVRKPQRTTLNSWAFHDLGIKIQYKARRAGVRVVYVNPAYTSQTCPSCGHVSRSNRKTRDAFCCVECGYAAPADTVGAINIALRGAGSAGSVNNPHAAGATA